MHLTRSHHFCSFYLLTDEPASKFFRDNWKKLQEEYVLPITRNRRGSDDLDEELDTFELDVEAPEEVIDNFQETLDQETKYKIRVKTTKEEFEEEQGEEEEGEEDVDGEGKNAKRRKKTRMKFVLTSIELHNRKASSCPRASKSKRKRVTVKSAKDFLR